MAKYTVRRVVGDLSQEEVDAAALRSLWCLADFPALEWLHSTWDKERGEITCLYEAPDEAQIMRHAEASMLPCDEIRAVSLIDPEEYLHG